MPIIIIVYLTAIAISAVAAYFSVVGLMGLFAATAMGVMVMAITLEIGKVVTTKLVHSLWQSKRANWLLKGPLVLMVMSLMSVTSLGIYGYLCKGHLEQKAPIDALDIQTQALQQQVDQKNQANQQLQVRLDQINQNINTFLTNNQATKGLRASNSLKSERDSIQKQIDANNQTINDLTTKLVPLKTQTSQTQANELGQLKYVAALFGIQDPDLAVRIVIFLIMIAFDPLAILLYIAASISYDDYKERQNPPVEEHDAPDNPLKAGVNVDTLDEIKRLENLNKTLQEEVEAFKADLAQAQAEVEREKMLLEAAKAAHYADCDDLKVAIATMEESQQKNEEATLALAELDKHLQAKTAELDKREADLADRIALLEKFFPAGTTDDQAVIALLEKNPKILEDIVEIIDQSKRKDQGGGPTMIIRS